jgi:hypothetical protein
LVVGDSPLRRISGCWMFVIGTPSVPAPRTRRQSGHASHLEGLPRWFELDRTGT